MPPHPAHHSAQGRTGADRRRQALPASCLFLTEKGAGVFPGAHYHLQKLEYCYIIEGGIKITWVDMDTGEASSTEAAAGDRVTIHPRCAHRFDAIEDVRVIEYFNSIHDPRDDHPYPALVEI
ncbi:MAG: cupin domain-containing protein [Syntrophobacteraceae bacterium]